MTTRLVIGSRNACGRSLATWLAMRMSKLSFEEVLVPLGRPETEGLLERFAPHGRLPVLIEPAATVWGTLPILEWLAERHAGLWPEDPVQRALARSVAAELQDGLQALHRFLPLDLIARFGPPGRLMRGVAADLKRVRQLWAGLRTGPAATQGPFLFGRFTIADALSAPLVARFVTYALPPQDPACAAYLAAMTELAPMREWAAEAASEVAAFDRIGTPPFHRSAAAPLPALAALLAPAERKVPTHPAAGVPAPAAGPRAPSSPNEVPAATKPLPAGAARPAGPRLEEVDRPPIAYLDAAGTIRAPSLSAAPPDPWPDLADGAGAERPGMPGPAAPAGGPPPREPSPTGPRQGQLPMAARPDSRPAARETETAGVAEPRARRPSAASAEPGGRPDNRFARALAPADRHANEPPAGQAAGRRVASEPPAAWPHPEPPGQERTPVDAGPGQPRTIRPSAIKPIGYSGQRRR